MSRHLINPRGTEMEALMGTWKGDSNPDGPGGTTRRIKEVRREWDGYNPTPYRGRRPAPTKKDGGCCPMVAAVKSARRGRFRLAKRYALMSVRLVAARIA